MPTVSLETLNQAFLTRNATVGVMGLGYVGLPLVKALGDQGFAVIGFDVDQERVKTLKEGTSYIKSFPQESLQRLLTEKRFEATHNPSDLGRMDAILICVPTPLTRHREPDMSYVVATAETILPNLRKGQLIVLESTTYPGTTKELVIPILERSGLKAGEDFFVAYSPEREDPGNPQYATSTIPKVVGADDPASRKLAISLYTQIVPKVVEASSAATAEAVKLTENIFRCINIAMVNELKVIYSEMGIDIWEVINAASTKPFGFMPFYPGPGLGGHCIPIDPFYLTWKAREYGVSTRFIELAGEVNTAMPDYVINQLREALDLRFAKALSGSRILLVGMAYKKNVDDIRESPSLAIFEALHLKRAQVDYYDPFVPVVHKSREHPVINGKESIAWTPESLRSYDAVLICTDHDDIDYGFLLAHSALVVDTRNATARVHGHKENVVKA
ncbi:MAG: UDP-N-acetyl-D-glucosamine dehydrogenase [Alphaproteobacteria bacterium]|jgi:UDP-N-acetyl-D-glucosamine dehydrogenase|nr:UDP-N-acetyl-D-glucosamine dehydrogenase [Alphaproteobacteria bacterium]